MASRRFPRFLKSAEVSTPFSPGLGLPLVILDPLFGEVIELV